MSGSPLPPSQIPPSRLPQNAKHPQRFRTAAQPGVRENQFWTTLLEVARASPLPPNVLLSILRSIQFSFSEWKGISTAPEPFGHGNSLKIKLGDFGVGLGAGLKRMEADLERLGEPIRSG